MRAVLDERDSLVVLPTGGGKSLCYQAPAVLRGDTTFVVAPRSPSPCSTLQSLPSRA